MFSRGIRGAITIEKDTEEQLELAVVELFNEILKINDIKIRDISHIIFTLTGDIQSAFPAKFIRKNFDADYVPMMCMNELQVTNSIPKCLRALVVINTEKNQDEIKHVYLKEAQKLRPDLSDIKISLH